MKGYKHSESGINGQVHIAQTALHQNTKEPKKQAEDSPAMINSVAWKEYLICNMSIGRVIS
ncbi:MAG: hypothetical protein HOK91_18340 [Gammaproteobacteria bacterium]|jgi:hypothetical protein|nr:hypothetical protein [Gammaproteobacteria bacterium]